MSDAETPKEKPTKVKRAQSVFTLLVQVGRKMEPTPRADV